MAILVISSSLADVAVGAQYDANSPLPKRPANRSNHTPLRSLRRGPSAYELYVLDQRAYRSLETEEMLTIARHMYNLSAAEILSATAEIQQIQRERWDNNKSISKFGELITKRAAFFQMGQGSGIDPAALQEKYKQLQRNPDFVKVLADIRRYDRRHPHRFTDYVQRLERVLAPAKVEEAHRHWNQRASTIRSSIQITELFRGMFSKIPVRKPHAKSKPAPRKNSRPSIKPQTPSRPGKPYSTVSRRPPSPAARTAKARPPHSPNRKIAAKPLNEWEKYVRDFIRTDNLSPRQTNAALSILKDLTSRAVQIEKANEPRIAEAKKMSDAKLKKKRLKELNEPIDILFVELKTRLERLLTADQLNRSKQPPRRSSRNNR